MGKFGVFPTKYVMLRGSRKKTLGFKDVGEASFDDYLLSGSQIFWEM